MSSYFQVYEYEDEEAMVRRATDVIKQAAEIQKDPELMAQVADALEAEHDCIMEAMDSIPEMVSEASSRPAYKEEMLDPDDPDSRVAGFLRRLSIDREYEAEKTNESPSARHRRLKKKSKRYDARSVG